MLELNQLLVLRAKGGGEKHLQWTVPTGEIYQFLMPKYASPERSINQENGQYAEIGVNPERGGYSCQAGDQKWGFIGAMVDNDRAELETYEIGMYDPLAFDTRGCSIQIQANEERGGGFTIRQMFLHSDDRGFFYEFTCPGEKCERVYGDTPTATAVITGLTQGFSLKLDGAGTGSYNFPGAPIGTSVMEGKESEGQRTDVKVTLRRSTTEDPRAGYYMEQTFAANKKSTVLEEPTVVCWYYKDLPATTMTMHGELVEGSVVLLNEGTNLQMNGYAFGAAWKRAPNGEMVPAKQ